MLSLNYLADKYLCSGWVRQGAFRGIRIESGSPITGRPKWLGAYEKELQSVWERVIFGRPKLIFDIGAAEGYYAAGLLIRLPNAIAYAWEQDQKTADLLRRNAVINSVHERLKIYGRCDADSLKTALASTVPDLVLCDAEGAELTLFSKSTAAELRHSVIVIESHSEEAISHLQDVFNDTHLVEMIQPQKREIKDWTLPPIIFATNFYKHWAVQERRTIATPWLIGWPKAS